MSEDSNEEARVLEVRAALKSLEPWTEALITMTQYLDPDDDVIRETHLQSTLLDLVTASRTLTDLSVRLTRAVAAYLVTERGISRSAVAEAAGVSRQAVNKWIEAHNTDLARGLDPRDIEPPHPFHVIPRR